MKTLLALAFLLSGCGTKLIDPCAHQSDACLAIHIDPSPTVSKLSQANIQVSGAGISVNQTESLQGGAVASDLPIAVAIIFKNLTAATPVHVVVDGMLDGTRVGEARVAQTIAPGQHPVVHVQLGAATTVLDMAAASDGATDMSQALPDLASSDLTNYVALSVALAGSGNGTVTASGLSCSGANCSGLYPPHSMVMLVASPAMNAIFDGWSGGGCSGSALSCSVTLDQAATVTATFDWKFVPSHVASTDYKLSAANLSGVSAIDTDSLTIDGSAPPAGVTFAIENGLAVLSVGTWDVTSNITITGAAPLVVIAAGPVVLSSTAYINANAVGTTSGPGGNSDCGAVGVGSSGASGGSASGGGGDFGGGASNGAQSAGMTYGAKLTDFCGGAPGGHGSILLTSDGACAVAGGGGGGGGAIQISSAVGITLQSGASIVANGGGGTGGCSHTSTSPPGSSSALPGGGGSGGDVFLEAPTISFADNSGCGANGGGGGGGITGVGTGPAGQDGTLAYQAALGGVGNATSGGNGAFSANGSALTPATAATMSGGKYGGGGGGVGRIWLRTRAAAPTRTPSSIVSPPPTIDLTL